METTLPSIGSLLNRLRRSSFLQDTAVLTIGTIVAQLLNALTLPILSRLYEPSSFGRLAVFIAIANITATLVTLRYELAIMLPRRQQEADSVTKLSILLAFALGFPFALLSWLLPISPKAVIGLSMLGEWLGVAVLMGVATALIAVAGYWLNRRSQYVVMSIQRVAQVLITSALAIALGFAVQRDGLLLGQLVGAWSVALGSLWYLRSALRASREPSLSATAREHRFSPTYLLPSALLDVISLQMPVLLISAWFGSAVAGQFSMAWRILWLPMALVGAAVAQVFYQRFLAARDDGAQSRRLLLSTWALLLSIGLVPALIVMAAGAPIFRFVLGREWWQAGEIASIISPMLLAMLVSSPTSSAMIALGKQRYMLVFGVMTFCLRPLCLWIGHVRGSLDLSLILFSVVEVSVIILYMFVLVRSVASRHR